MIEKSEISLRVAVIDTLPIKRGLLYNPCLAGVAEVDVGRVEPDDLGAFNERRHSDDTSI